MEARAATREEWRWRGIRDNAELADRLERIGLDKYAEALRDCRTTWTTTLCECCGAPGRVETHCKQRLCVMCAATKARENAKSVALLSARYKAGAFITLTMRRVRLGRLNESLTAIRKAFVRFRSYGAIKRRLRGGVAAIEIVYEPARAARDGRQLAEGWHVHMHLLADADYIPHPWLRRLWGKALRQRIGEQYDAVVDIKRASGPKLARYISKYITKPSDLLNWPDSALEEFCSGIRKRRLIATFGAYFKLSLSKLLNRQAREPLICPECNAIGSMLWARAGPRIFGRDWPDWRTGSKSKWGNWDYTQNMELAELGSRPEWIPLPATIAKRYGISPCGCGDAMDVIPKKCPETAENADF